MAHLPTPHIMPLSKHSTQGTTSHPPDSNIELGPVAQLLTIDVGRLHEGDKEEAAKLFKAAKEDGIFYLDLQDRRSMAVIDTVDDVFALSKDLFSLSEEEKMKYDIDELDALKLNG